MSHAIATDAGLAWQTGPIRPRSCTCGSVVCQLLHERVMSDMSRRMLMVALIFLVGIGVSALSSALSYGPVFAWDWLDQSTRLGLGLALALALLQVGLPRRYCVLLLLMGVMIDVNLLNQAPPSPYYATALQSWEQGRFIRFYGLGQWLGWLWPYATLLYVLMRVSRRERH